MVKTELTSNSKIECVIRLFCIVFTFLCVAGAVFHPEYTTNCCGVITGWVLRVNTLICRIKCQMTFSVYNNPTFVTPYRATLRGSNVNLDISPAKGKLHIYFNLRSQSCFSVVHSFKSYSSYIARCVYITPL